MSRSSSARRACCSICSRPNDARCVTPDRCGDKALALLPSSAATSAPASGDGWGMSLEEENPTRPALGSSSRGTASTSIRCQARCVWPADRQLIECKTRIHVVVTGGMAPGPARPVRAPLLERAGVDRARQSARADVHRSDTRRRLRDGREYSVDPGRHRNLPERQQNPRSSRRIAADSWPVAAPIDRRRLRIEKRSRHSRCRPHTVMNRRWLSYRRPGRNPCQLEGQQARREALGDYTAAVQSVIDDESYTKLRRASVAPWGRRWEWTSPSFRPRHLACSKRWSSQVSTTVELPCSTARRWCSNVTNRHTPHSDVPS